MYSRISRDRFLILKIFVFYSAIPGCHSDAVYAGTVSFTIYKLRLITYAKCLYSLWTCRGIYGLNFMHFVDKFSLDLFAIVECTDREDRVHGLCKWNKTKFKRPRTGASPFVYTQNQPFLFFTAFLHSRRSVSKKTTRHGTINNTVFT